MKYNTNMYTQTRHAQNRYQLRLHRARSVVLTPSELVEIRAAQRTFEGAYIRTSLGQFSFALVVLKIFTSEFYSIGMSGDRSSHCEYIADAASQEHCLLSMAQAY